MDDLWRRHEQVPSSRREEVYAALQYAASFRCWVEEWKDCEEHELKSKEKWIFVDKKSEETKRHTEWCATANKYRCMRCGRGSKYLKTQRKCAEPKWLLRDMKSGWAGRSFDLVLEMLLLCATKDGTQIDELLYAGETGHDRKWIDVLNES